MDSLRLYLFGSPRLEKNGRLAALDTRKALALLAVLAISGQEQQRESLVALFYPEADPEDARGAFRRTLSTLNRALGAGVLDARREAVGLAAGAGLWVDVLEFQVLRAKQGERNALERAASLYQEDFMAGFSLRDSPAFDDWQYRQSEELRRNLVGVLDRLAGLAAAAGDFERAVQHAARRVAIDPLLEEGQRQLMLLYAQAGQRSAAVRQYRECVRVLEQELGVLPLEETTRLYQEIFSGRLEATRPPLTAPGSQMESPIPAAALAEPGVGPAYSVPLVGREKEILTLTAALRSSPARGLFISLEGEAGVGKTRLADEFLAAAGQAGRTVVRASCYEGEVGLAYGPFLQGFEAALAQPDFTARLEQLPDELLAEAARLLPGLASRVKHPLPPALPDSPGAQTRFFEGLRRLCRGLLGAEPPGILFIDDLHWADSASLDLLAYLVHRLDESGFWILASWRREEVPNIQRLHQLLAEQQRAGRSLHLPIHRLNAAEITSLARARLSSSGQAELSPGFAERLFAESEGLPFIALEYLNSLETSGVEWEMPTGVRDLLHRRLLTPAEASRQLLAAAAVIGRPFDFTTLQAVSGRSEWEVVTGLEELLNLGLISEESSSEYDFSHEKLRSVAYTELSSARRRLLHLRAGEALAASGHAGRDTRAWAGLAANHFLQAGMRERAAEDFHQAGEHARRLHANSEALEAFRSALEAGHPDSAGLHEACGDLYTLQGKYREAVDSYQAAAAFCDPPCISNLMHKLGEVYHRRGEWDAAESHYQAALDAAGAAASPALLAHLYADWSLTALRQGQADPARRLAGQALHQARAADDPGALAQATNILGILARADGKMEEAQSFFENSLDSAARQDDPSMLCAVLNNLARLLQERGRVVEAVPLARQALEICARIGDRHREAAIHNTLADLYHAADQEELAMAELKQAVTLFAEIGEAGGPGQPEIWKLTEW